MKVLMGVVMVAALLAQSEQEGPPKLKRGIPKHGQGESSTTARPEMTPTTGPAVEEGEAKPVEKAAGEEAAGEVPAKAPQVYKEIVTDAEGRVVDERVGGVGPDGSRIDPFIEKAREVAFQWVDSLPNFICQQITYRSQSDTKPADWKMHDRVTAELWHEGAKDDFKNVEVNGKKLKKGSPEDSGSWSVGEFGAMAADVLNPASQTKFEKRGSDTVGSRVAKWYDYEVEQANSHWRVTFEGQTIYPAYKGSIWIDEETHRVTRLEIVARKIPEDYPMDKVEMMVEDGKVRIGQTDYLMPVKSGSLACKRGTFTCVNNETEYRNYRKFSSESTIMTTESTVTFEGAEEGKKAEEGADAKGKKTGKKK